VRDLQAEAMRVPEFWSLEPEAAALAYVEHNRPPSIASRYVLSTFDPSGEGAPQEGDVTLGDGPWGCFAPRGVSVHHLHCAREGATLVFAQRVANFMRGPLPANPFDYDFRALKLSYARAHQFLEIIWWLNRIESRKVGTGEGEFLIGGRSTDDGPATAQLVYGKQRVLIEGMRRASFEDGYGGVGQY
jgi:hypothetical protein